MLGNQFKLTLGLDKYIFVKLRTIVNECMVQYKIHFC